jgi:cell division protein FtsB
MSALWSNYNYEPPEYTKSDNSPRGSRLWSILADKIPWGISCFCILAIIGYIFLSEAGLVRSSGLAETKVSLEAENYRLEEENRQLAIRLNRIREDPGYLEDEARKKLGVVRPNETIYRLAEEPDLSDEELKGQLQ